MTVRLLDRTRTGTDSFNRPVYEERAEEVENVLVGLPTAWEQPARTELTARRVRYVLGIPKGDGHTWENRRVVLPEPFAGTYQVVGLPTAGIEENVPLPWNRRVLVERYG